jgi:hypothetical protein
MKDYDRDREYRDRDYKSYSNKRPSRFSENPTKMEPRDLRFSYGSPKFENVVEAVSEPVVESAYEEEVNIPEPVNTKITIPSCINREDYIRPYSESIIPAIKEYKIYPNYLVIQLAKKRNRLTAKDQANLNLNEYSIDQLTTQYLSTFSSEIPFDLKEIEMKPLPLFYFDEAKILPPQDIRLKYLQSDIYNFQRKLDKENHDKLALKEKILLMNLENEELKARQSEKQKRLDEIFSDY